MTEIYAVAITVTAARDTLTGTPVLLNDDQVLAEVNADDGSPGTNSVRFACVTSGLATPPAAGANSTLIQSITNAAGFSTSAVRETTAGQGSRPVGFTGTADDVAAVHLAVLETPAPPTPSAPRRNVESLLARWRRY